MSITDDYTTNLILEKEANRLKIPLNYCWKKADLDLMKKKGAYIINLGDGQGTHWVCVWKEGLINCYFDAFGFLPPKAVVENSIGKIYYNSAVIQDPNHGGCGSYCISMAEYMNEHKAQRNPVQRFKDFCNLFHDNFKRNRRVVNTLVTDD